MIPGTNYADSGDLQIAYQVVGDGLVDVVVAVDWAGNIELMWENPQTERFLRRFASYGRPIFFDMRGIGLSDPVQDLPPLEEWMDDVRAVMDAVGSDRAARAARLVLGWSGADSAAAAAPVGRRRRGRPGRLAEGGMEWWGAGRPRAVCGTSMGLPTGDARLPAR